MSIKLPPDLIRTLTTLVVMFHLLVAQGMAASADFHHHCHEHSEDPCHECVVTLMTQGGYDQFQPDIRPVCITQEEPETVAFSPNQAVITPSHLLGGVLAQAPPRGP